VLPEPQIRESVAVVPGMDGQKMSKSYGNTIEIFGEKKPSAKKSWASSMDSRTPPNPSRTRTKTWPSIAQTRRPPKSLG
jgi:tryptophanyl-tRNA synthetase